MADSDVVKINTMPGIGAEKRERCSEPDMFLH